MSELLLKKYKGEEVFIASKAVQMIDQNSCRKPRVMLINPPQTFYGESLGFNVYFPIGLLNIAAAVRDICEVRILDCLVADFEVNKSEGFTVYGTPLGVIKKRIKEFDPNIIGISIPFSAQSQSARDVGRICKEVNPNAVVVCGGPHASVRYTRLLQEGVCDYCIIGEGEMIFQEFVRRFSAKDDSDNINGVACIKNGEVTFTPSRWIDDLDTLPLPAYDMIDVGSYLRNPYLYKSRSVIRDKSISMITSRGCPFDCVFCSIHLHMGKRYRYHSVDYVVRHLRWCIDKMGIRNFHFEDDNISLNKERFESLLDRIIAEKLNIQWDTPNGIRADTLDFKLLKKIKESGCRFLRIAIESGNQRVLDEVIKKKSKLDDAISVAEYCNDLGIKLAAFYVIGFPGETMHEIMDTINLAIHLYKSNNVYPILLFATPLYGTELYNICIKNSLIKENISDEEIAKATQFYGEPLISTKDFNKDDLKSIAREFEIKMDRIIGKGSGSLRKILTDQQSLFKKNAD